MAHGWAWTMPLLIACAEGGLVPVAIDRATLPCAPVKCSARVRIHGGLILFVAAFVARTTAGKRGC
jgi:hypothetical protein